MSKKLLSLAFLLYASTYLLTKSSYAAPINIPVSALEYLLKYNYIHPVSLNSNSKSLSFDRGKNNHKSARMEALTNPDISSIMRGIKMFQRFANLNITGVLDEKTKQAMTWPRCGVVDVQLDEDDQDLIYGDQNNWPIDDYVERKRRPPHRAKRYSIQGSKWRKNILTFKIDNYTKDIDVTVTDEQIRKALLVWSKHANLTFVQRYFTDADVVVSFEKFNHYDGEPFDGPGKVLAHAFFPQFGGDVHFDDSELWTTSPYRGSNLYQVAAHEFGHSLGLSHSTKRSSLMAPFYKTFMGTIELDYDDILGIQRLYGAPPNYYSSMTSTTATPKPKPSSAIPSLVYRKGGVVRNELPQGVGVKLPEGGARGALDDTFYGVLFPGNTRSTPHTDGDMSQGDFATTEPDLCKNPNLDAITTTADGQTIAFRGKYYWELNSYGVQKGFPRLISQDWLGLPDNLDAALSWGSKSNKTFFFKGSKYWRFSSDKTPDLGYPKYIYKGFPGLPDNIDAAFVWSGNGMTYFIKGNQYWRYAGTSFDKVDDGYPKQLFIWQGVPVKVDAAMRWTNGKTYFFSGSKYYRFNDEAFKVDETFPRSAALWWFGCYSDKYNYYSGRYDSLVAKKGSLRPLSNTSISFPIVRKKFGASANMRATPAGLVSFEEAYDRVRNRGDFSLDPDGTSEMVHSIMMYGGDQLVDTNLTAHSSNSSLDPIPKSSAKWDSIPTHLPKRIDVIVTTTTTSGSTPRHNTKFYSNILLLLLTTWCLA